MLAVAIHGHRPGEPLLTRRRPAMNEGGAFALGVVMAEDLGAGGLRESAGAVGGTVVDHEDVGEVALDAGDEVADGRRLVETRDDHATVRTPIHGAVYAGKRMGFGSPGSYGSRVIAIRNGAASVRVEE